MYWYGAGTFFGYPCSNVFACAAGMGAPWLWGFGHFRADWCGVHEFFLSSIPLGQKI